jgi:hypothetical protein
MAPRIKAKYRDSGDARTCQKSINLGYHIFAFASST